MIDIILVSVISTFITSNSYINKDYKKYTDLYEEYQDSYENYNDFITKFKDKKITENEYNEIKEEYEDYIIYLDDIELNKKISSNKYNSIIEKVNKDYSKIEENYSYNLVKLSMIPTIMSIVCILMYFVVIQYYFNGQTLGKKIANLQVKSNNDKPLTILNYFIRCLIVNEVFVNVISLLCLIILNKKGYIVYSQIIYVITYILEVIVIFTITFNKENRGIHDLISNTKVIDLKK